MFEEHARAVTQILPDRFHKSSALHFVSKVSDAPQISKTLCGRQTSFFRRHSPLAIGFDLHFEMSAQLVVDVVENLIAPEQRAESCD